MDRLEEYAGVLNLPPSGYSRATHVPVSGQLSLLGESPLIVVIGRMCAGKTTFGEYCSQRLGLPPIEASSVVRLLSGRSHIHSGNGFETARELLEARGADVVAKGITSLFQEDLRKGAVVTGFRTVEEIAWIKRMYPDVRVVWVEASERTRYHRHLARGRGRGDCGSIQRFRGVDREQEEFGLLRVGRMLADVEIVNEGSMSDYHQKIAGSVEPSISPDAMRKAARASRKNQRSQLYRCLRVLEDAKEPLSSSEIAGVASSLGANILPKVNKVLRIAGVLVARHEEVQAEIRYELRGAGLAFLRLLKQARQPRVHT